MKKNKIIILGIIVMALIIALGVGFKVKNNAVQNKNSKAVIEDQSTKSEQKNSDPVDVDLSNIKVVGSQKLTDSKGNDVIGLKDGGTGIKQGETYNLEATFKNIANTEFKETETSTAVKVDIYYLVFKFKLPTLKPGEEKTVSMSTNFEGPEEDFIPQFLDK